MSISILETPLIVLPEQSAVNNSSDCFPAKIIALKLASYLTEPICKVREYFYTFYILDEMCKTTAQKVMKVTFLVLGIVLFTLLTPFTAPIGAALRGTVAAFESKPYIYVEKDQKGLKQFSL
jgi:hypothetical protein